jgi:hypothetical protein
MDELRPPYLLCGLILLATLAGCAAFALTREDRSAQATAAVSGMSKDLSQVVELSRIYSNPPVPEDPTSYRQKSPSDRRPKPLRSL